jgi:hypothetical protein
MGDMADWDREQFEEDMTFGRSYAVDSPAFRKARNQHNERFVETLVQEETWQAWIDGRFVTVRISEMTAEHAANAAKWLMRNRKRIRNRVQSYDPQFMLGFGVVSTAREVVGMLPVYRALKQRAKCPPNQNFTRKQLSLIAEHFGLTGANDSDATPDELSKLKIASKAAKYLRNDA